MPGFITHYLFGRNILSCSPNNLLTDSIKSNIHAFQLGLQGPDIFFYDIASLMKQGIGNIGSYMHCNQSNAFFKNYIRIMDSLPIEEKNIAISYLSGFLCHYFLDTTCHPYIYYKSGLSSHYKEPTKEYYASHRMLETEIDTIFLHRYQHKLNVDFHKERVILLSKKELDLISLILSTSISRTYQDISIHAYRIQMILRSMKYECKLLFDKYGRKKNFFQVIENKFFNYNVITSIIPSDDDLNEDDLLNCSHTKWYSPWNQTAVCDSSFIDLVQLSKLNCFTAFYLLDRYLLSTSSKTIQEDLRQRLLHFIGNKSYHTGLDCRICDKILESK